MDIFKVDVSTAERATCSLRCPAPETSVLETQTHPHPQPLTHPHTTGVTNLPVSQADGAGQRAVRTSLTPRTPTPTPTHRYTPIHTELS